MKMLLFSIALSISIIPSSIIAKSIIPKSHISKVTIFPEGAMLLQVVDTKEIIGANEIIINGLPTSNI